MIDNIISMRKADNFYLCRGSVNETGDVIESERVGVAYLKPSSAIFRLRLWMFPKGEFFLAREEENQYQALCRDEYEVGGVGRNQWHKIGAGEVVGSHIRIRLHLLPEDIFLNLFPKREMAEAVFDAA